MENAALRRLSLALTAAVLLVFLRVEFSLNTPLDGLKLFLKTLAVSGPLAVMLVALYAALGDASPRFSAHLAAGIAGVVLMAGYYGAAWVNAEFDSSPPEEHVVGVVDWGRSRQWNEDGPWWLDVESWRLARSRETIFVNSWVHRDAQYRFHSSIRVWTKPGRLGYEWVSDCRLVR